MWMTKVKLPVQRETKLVNSRDGTDAVNTGGDVRELEVSRLG